MIGNCVVDASVGIKLFIVEDLSSLADQLLDQLAADPPVRFYVPDLFFVECANVLWKYVSMYGYAAESARQDIIDLQALNLDTVSTADVLSPSFNLAIRYDITAYDACYVALAEQLALPLITADGTLVRKLAGSGMKVRLLSDLN